MQKTVAVFVLRGITKPVATGHSPKSSFVDVSDVKRLSGHLRDGYWP